VRGKRDGEEVKTGEFLGGEIRINCGGLRLRRAVNGPPVADCRLRRRAVEAAIEHHHLAPFAIIRPHSPKINRLALFEMHAV